jgi:hypothetical protein
MTRRGASPFGSGLKSAFIARPGQQAFPLAPAADLEVPDLIALADVLAG